MSEPMLRTHTERCRDQTRIEGLEAELAAMTQQADLLAVAYTDVLTALVEAKEWRTVATLMALAGGFLAIFAIRAFGL